MNTSHSLRAVCKLATAAVFVLVAAGPAQAQILVYNFKGQIDFVPDALSSGPFAVGQAFDVTVSVDSLAPDVFPGDPDFGGYDGVVGLSGNFGGYLLSFGGTGNGLSVIRNAGGDYWDLHAALSGPSVGGLSSLSFSAAVIWPIGTLPSDAIPTSLPSLALATLKNGALSFSDTPTTGWSASGPLTSATVTVIPEPGAAALLLSGLAVVLRRARRPQAAGRHCTR